MTKELKGHLTISRPQCGGGEKYISITFVDEKSSAEFLAAKIDLANFAEALTGLGRVECSFELRPSLVGKTEEIKDVEVIVSDGAYSLTDKQLEDILAPYERNGWKGHLRDLKNHHRRTTHGYTVTFERYV